MVSGRSIRCGSLIDMTAPHVCTHGVCSWTLTPEALTALGFPVKVTVSMVGSTVVVTEGMEFGAAKHAAWAAGVTRLCTKGLGR